MKQLLFLIILALLSLSCFAQSGYVHGAFREKYGEPGAEKGEAWMKNMMNGKVEAEYKFPVMMQMHMTSYKNGNKKDESDMTYYLNGPAKLFAMKASEERKKKNGDEMLIIYDYTANSMLMLNETDKTGMAMNINAFMSGDAIKRREQGGDTKGNSNTSCKKTGKTKVIRGYSCDQYVCVDEDQHSRSEVWVTNKLPFDLSQANSRGPFTRYFAGARGLGGMMMEGDFYKNDELEMKMEVTDLNSSLNMLIKSADYKFAMR